MSIKITFFVLAVALFACAPTAQAATCTNTAYNKITCVQAFLNNSGSCTTGGSTQNGYATVTAGHMLLLYEGMGSGSGNSVTITGNLGTVWTAVPNQPNVAWGSGSENYTFSAFTAIPTSSGSLNLTFTCGTNNNADTESVFVEMSSSVGTISIDCSSAWTLYNNSTGPFGQTTTPLCVSTHANDLNVSRVNDDGTVPSTPSGWTELTEVTSDEGLAVQAGGSPGTVNGVWGSTGSQYIIVGSIAFSDGSSSPVFTFGLR